MGVIISWLLVIPAAVLAIPAAVVCCETLVGILRPNAERYLTRDPNLRIAVLVPARNESAIIASTLADIKAQLGSDDILLVVADNCSDDTAEVAERAGAKVIVRCDPRRIGKGYALDFGVRHLDRLLFDFVVMIDADCCVESNAISQLAGTCAATGRPAQALYLMNVPEGSRINHQVSAFAWRIKNWIRPLGLSGLHFPCQLMGTGMAFPRRALQTVDLASGSLVEDLELGLDLAAAGYPPLFCPSARITSKFATSEKGAADQRRRWEAGHLATIAKQTRRLLAEAIKHRNPDLLALTLDMAVPPLSFLTMLLSLMIAIDAVAMWFGTTSTALLISTISLFAFGSSILLAWMRCGRDVLPFRAVLMLPMFIASKLRLYGHVLFGKATSGWIGTDRSQT